MKWTKADLEALPEHTKRLNPQLFQPVGGLPDTEREQHPVQTLVRRPRPQRAGKKRVAIVVEVLSLRRKRIDDDNLIAGAKSLRDAIARSLAVDDGDSRIQWHYHQIISAGQPGTQVVVTAK